ncbi:hypothetical protein LX16_3762 [Stackebrandtia albiflava]|uniref:Secreted protein n=1 Tax=Stackebrandtia albiflava TaxID=406432 RepID=A0A562V563_9ACTN|nr:hypothetical protein [Stackebrandtia albiflava]TWJ12995.1 hypothetical protein LX16_3762 [Stackebrandtia albiflava]
MVWRLLLTAGLALALTGLSGCSSWSASAGSEAQRTADAIGSEAQVMSLVNRAAQRRDPPTITLSAIMSDVDSALGDAEDAAVGLATDDPARPVLLELVSDSMDTAADLREAVESGDRAALRDLEPVIAELASEAEAL